MVSFDPGRLSPGEAQETVAREEARRLEAENPLWIVVYGVFSKEFVCFPRFVVPGGVIVAARYPEMLLSRMRRVESSARDAVAALKAR